MAGQPLFDCVDEIALTEGINDLAVTCRVVSMHAVLTKLSVRVYVGSERNFTIDTRDIGHPSSLKYPDDERYEVIIKPIPRVRD